MLHQEQLNKHVANTSSLNAASVHSSFNQSIPQNANCVVMVPPKEFQFNPETAKDNEFQHHVELTDAQITENVMMEFNNMVAELRRNGVQVVEFDYPVSDVKTPDAVFPNNWFSTTVNGEFFSFPMACKNRQMEVRSEVLVEQLASAGRHVTQVDTFEHFIEKNAFLESTGVMVMDHGNKTVYAALSQRCDREALEEYAERIGYPRVVSFQTALPSGHPIYHTNVMMAIGENFCVICDELIPEFERRFVIKSLAKDKQVISISLDQMNQFCGNILQLESVNGSKVIAMSQSAYDAFTPAQITQLSGHGKLLPFDVSTIETIGGGSVRCMLGEVFLPTRKSQI